MLGNSSYSKILVCGSTSEIAYSILEHIGLQSISKLTLTGRTEPNLSHFKDVADVKFKQIDFSEISTVGRLFSELLEGDEYDLAIISFGYLPKEYNHFDISEIDYTLRINTIATIQILSLLTEKMINQGFGQIVTMSTIAASVPRPSNFVYGSSKIATDFFTRGLRNSLRNSNVAILQIRPGYVFTKFSKDYKPAIFAVNVNIIGRFVLRKLRKSNNSDFFAPSGLWLIAVILKIIPAKLLKYIENKLNNSEGLIGRNEM